MITFFFSNICFLCQNIYSPNYNQYKNAQTTTYIWPASDVSARVQSSMHRLWNKIFFKWNNMFDSWILHFYQTKAHYVDSAYLRLVGDDMSSMTTVSTADSPT